MAKRKTTTTAAKPKPKRIRFEDDETPSAKVAAPLRVVEAPVVVEASVTDAAVATSKDAPIADAPIAEAPIADAPAAEAPPPTRPVLSLVEAIVERTGDGGMDAGATAHGVVVTDPGEQPPQAQPAQGVPYGDISTFLSDATSQAPAELPMVSGGAAAGQGAPPAAGTFSDALRTRMTPEQRAELAVQWGPMVDGLLGFLAGLAGSNLTPDAIIRRNHAMASAAAIAAGKPPPQLPNGAPFDVDLTALRAGRYEDAAVSHFAIVGTLQQDPKTGGPQLDSGGRPIYGSVSFHAGYRGLMLDNATQTLNIIPATTGMSVIYNIAQAPKAVIEATKRWLEKNENTVRFAAAAVLLGFHGVAVLMDVRARHRAQDNARNTTGAAPQNPPPAATS